MLIDIIDKFFLIYLLMIFTRIISSWFPEFQGHQAIRFVAYYTDPYLDLFRRFIPPLGMLDISPMVALFALKIIEELVKWPFR